MPAAAVLVATMMIAVTACDPGPPPARHLILVVFDTLRADRVGLYGHAAPTTPFLDSKEEELLVYERVKAPAPWTVPTHASMFTGLRPAVHRAQWGSMSLAGKYTTLAERLAEAGFCTAALSANRLVGPETGLDQGFARYEVHHKGRTRRSQEILRRIPTVLDEAEEQGCRLFLYLNFMDAHMPFNSARYAAEFGVRGRSPADGSTARWSINAGTRTFTKQQKRKHRRSYAAAVRLLDDHARTLWEMLQDRGLLEESILLFTSDHGEGLGAHQVIGHVLSVWEAQLAVPLMVRLPGGHRGGERFSPRTSLTALAPSLYDWLRVDRPQALAGKPDLEQAPEAIVSADYRSYFSETNYDIHRSMAERFPELAERIQHLHAVYCGDNKLIVDAKGRSELYDLVRDPLEQTPIDPSGTAAGAECRNLYRAAVEEGRLTPFDAEPPEHEAPGKIDEEALRALGYIQ